MTEACTDVDGGLNLTDFQNGDWVAHYDVNFEGGAYGFEARVASDTSGGTIEVRVDAIDGPLLGSCTVANTGGPQNWVNKSVPISNAFGLRKVYLKFTGGSGDLFSMNRFTFSGQSFTRIEAESRSLETGIQLKTSGDVGGGQNVAYISHDDWCKYDAVALTPNTVLNARVARPSGKADSQIEVRLDSPTGTLLGTVEVPFTGGWQTYETVQTTLGSATGTHDIYFVFVESDTTTISGSSLLNLNWFELFTPEVPGSVAAAPVTASQVDLSWSTAATATSYRVMRATSSSGPFVEASTNWRQPSTRV